MMRVILEDSKLGQVQTGRRGQRTTTEGASLELFGHGEVPFSGQPRAGPHCLDQNCVHPFAMSKKI